MVGISPRDQNTIGDMTSILPDSVGKGARAGQEVPKAMDKEGSVGKQFTGKSLLWDSGRGSMLIARRSRSNGRDGREDRGAVGQGGHGWEAVHPRGRHWREGPGNIGRI